MKLFKIITIGGLGYMLWKYLEKYLEGKNRTQFGLVVWRAEHLPTGWQPLLKMQGWDFVSVKVLDGTKAYDAPRSTNLVRELRQLGITVHGWGFHYCDSSSLAKAEGVAAAKQCVELGLTDYHWDAEDAWRDSDNPEAYAIAFCEAFRAAGGTNVRLWMNGYSGPMTAKAIQHFDVYEPQLYGTKPSTIDKVFRDRLNKFGRGIKRAAMVGTGRVDEKGNVWGWLADQGGVPGLVSLVLRERPVAVSFFRAPFMLAEGNKHNPPLAAQLATLRDALDRAPKDVA